MARRRSAPGGTAACPQKRNGKKQPHGTTKPQRRGSIRGEMYSTADLSIHVMVLVMSRRRMRPLMMALRLLPLSLHFQAGEAHLACMIWLAMFGNGCPIGMILTIIKCRPRPTRPGQRKGRIKSCAAVHGSIRAISWRRRFAPSARPCSTEF